MPLPIRKVEPVFVSRGNLPSKYKIQDDLEAESHGTLTQVILQLSSLSHHAEEIFSELIRAATEISTKTIRLRGRLDVLTEKAYQMERYDLEFTLQDCVNSKLYQSSTAVDQQVVLRHTMSTGMLKKLESCGRPPPLENLNIFRDDGKDGLKFYSDPNYFFELWKQQVLKDAEKATASKAHKPKKVGCNRQGKKSKPVRAYQTRAEKQRLIAIAKGEHIMPTVLSNTDAKPLEVGDDGIVYLPDMPKGKETPSRPTTQDSLALASTDDDGDVRSNSNSKLNDPPLSEKQRTGTDALAESKGRRRLSRKTASRESLPPPPPPPVSRGALSMLIENIQSDLEDIELLAGGGLAPLPLPYTPPPSPNQLNPRLNRNTMPPPPMPPKYDDLIEEEEDMYMDIEDGLPPPPPVPGRESVRESMVRFPPPPARGFSQSETDTDPGPAPPTPPPPLDEDVYDALVAKKAPPPPFREPIYDAPIPQNAPPPPPPPPLMPPPGSIPEAPGAPGSGPVPPVQSQSTGLDLSSIASVKLLKRTSVQKPKPVDSRSELLNAIRGGINLRKVEASTKEDKSKGAYGDVASILDGLRKIRVAVELSDSESPGSSECDDSDW